MAAEDTTRERVAGDDPVAPPTEQIHLPGPTLLPVVVALGITIALVGVVLNWVVFGIGFLIFAVATLMWVRDTRRDISDLPLEH